MNIKKEPITSRLRITNKARFTLFVSILIITLFATFMPAKKHNPRVETRIREAW